MISSKQLVRKAFESADLPRLPFIPWVFSHAARLEQVPLRRIYTDPTHYTKCLQNAQKLYGYDCTIGGFDSSLETEICGRPFKWGGDYEMPLVIPDPNFSFNRLKEIDVESATKAGRFGTVIESLRRINQVSGETLALAAVVTGPLTFIARLTGRDPLHDLIDRPQEAAIDIEAAAGFLLKIVQVYCQLELDIIVVADRMMTSLPTTHLSLIRSALSPALNTIRFYNSYSVLLPGESFADNIGNLADLGFDGIVASGVDSDKWQRIQSGRRLALGRAIPTAIINSGKKEMTEYVKTHVTRKIEPGVFLTTEWEIPPETPPENIHRMMRILRGGE